MVSTEKNPRDRQDPGATMCVSAASTHGEDGIRVEPPVVGVENHRAQCQQMVDPASTRLFESVGNDEQDGNEEHGGENGMDLIRLSSMGVVVTASNGGRAGYSFEPAVERNRARCETTGRGRGKPGGGVGATSHNSKALRPTSSKVGEVPVRAEAKEANPIHGRLPHRPLRVDHGASTETSLCGPGHSVDRASSVTTGFEDSDDESGSRPQSTATRGQGGASSVNQHWCPGNTTSTRSGDAGNALMLRTMLPAHSTSGTTATDSCCLTSRQAVGRQNAESSWRRSGQSDESKSKQKPAANSENTDVHNSGKTGLISLTHGPKAAQGAGNEQEYKTFDAESGSNQNGDGGAEDARIDDTSSEDEDYNPSVRSRMMRIPVGMLCCIDS